MEVAEDPITTKWVEVFDTCTRFSRATSYAEYSRYDACAAPEKSARTLCTWMAALGRTCANRNLPIDWMGNQNLSDHCARPGMTDR